MGHTPSQQPSDGDPERVPTTGDDAAVVGRVRRRLTAFVDGVRRRLSVFSDLDLAAAFSVEDESTDVLGRPSRGQSEEEPLPVQRTEETALAIPERAVPFTRPARDTDDENPPDLECTEQDGSLSIYHPEHEGAEITSDTYHRVEP